MLYLPLSDSWRLHTHIGTHNKSIFILALPWLFMPSSISPLDLSTSCLSVCFLCFYVVVYIHPMTDEGFSCQPLASHIILVNGEWTAFTKSINYESQVLYNGWYSSLTDGIRAAMRGQWPARWEQFWVQCFAQGHFQMLSGRVGKQTLIQLEVTNMEWGSGVLSKACAELMLAGSKKLYWLNWLGHVTRVILYWWWNNIGYDIDWSCW